ncbi:unnamed protein product, partial [Leptidea sinapis]
MESVDNNTISYDKLINFNQRHVINSTMIKETWPIEKCLELHLTNETYNDNISNVFIYNNTEIYCLEHAPLLTRSRIVRASILSVMAVLSFVGNFATMISVQRGKRCRRRARPSWTAIYSLIFQLSIADLFVTLFCIAGEAAWSFTVKWYGGNVLCKLFKFLQMFALYLSTFVLVLIGVDRWLAVKYPMKSMGTATRSTRLLIVAWILSIVLKSEKVFQPETIRQEKYVTPDLNRRRLIDRAKMKSLRMSIVIVVTFIVWWTPYYIMMLIFTFVNPTKSVVDDWMSAIFFFGMSNSLVNPVIYGAFHLWPKKRSRNSE